MKSISFIISNFNTLKYAKWCYNSIRKNLGYVHEIVMLDDGSDDGTWEWLQEVKETDANMVIHKNSKNVGIAYSYNKMVELANNEIICMLHPDMYVPPKFDEIMLKHMENYDFITPLRVEPNVGYPESVDKFLIDFGTRSEEFEEDKFIRWSEENSKENKGRVEQRMFFPWMTTKTLYDEVGGNDILFLKYMVDDDDFYLRVKNSNYRYTQLFETAVYHMPSKSVRMREDGKNGENNPDFQKQYLKSHRNFIRKWGKVPAGVWDENRDMVLPERYNVGFIAKNCTLQILGMIEPFCQNIYIEDRRIIMDYINEEQPKTLFDLSQKIKPITQQMNNDILIEFDCQKFTEGELDAEKNIHQSLNFLSNISDIIKDSGQIGVMQYSHFGLDIKQINNIGYNKWSDGGIQIKIEDEVYGINFD